MSAPLATPLWLNTVQALVSPSLRATTERLCPPMRLVTGYHHGWLDAVGQPVTGGGGKAVRPALSLLSAQAAGAPAESGVPAAVAVELVHNYSLLHDDIMDGDTERRHRPTAWTIFGVSSAILAGDALLTAAFEVLMEKPTPSAVEAARRLAATAQRLIAGQCADLEFEKRTDIALDDCLRMAADKTAALLSCATCLGAVWVGADAALCAGLADFGWHLGVAFQMTDDLLGIWGDVTVTGKPAMEDLRARKKSVPVVSALRSGHPAAERLREYYSRPLPPGGADLPAMAALVEECGGRDHVTALAAAEYEAALRCLDGLVVPAGVRADLTGLARFIVRRDN
jgi:geranylgeranyl diphosphate synthase type I